MTSIKEIFDRVDGRVFNQI